MPATPRSPPRATARACTTRPGCWARGSPTWRTSCSASRRGGWHRWRCGPGCRRWRARCGRCQLPRRPRRRGCRAWRSGPAWRCCWRPAPRSNGRACTAGKRCCPATPAVCWATRWGRCRCAGWASPARACCGSPRWWSAWPRWRCAFRGSRLADAHRRAHRRAARAPRRDQGTRRRPPHRRTGAARARGRRRGRAPGDRGPRAHRHRAAGAGGAEVRARGQGTPAAAVRRAGRHQAAAGRPARRRARPPGDGDTRVAGDDQPADREEAEGLRRRGACGRGLAGAR